jgi:hypothetical protein
LEDAGPTGDAAAPREEWPRDTGTAPTLNETNIWLFNNASAAALAHWYELDPAGARPAILREIVRPKPRFGAAVLGILPDKELPEVEQTLVDHLLQSQNHDGSANLASLIHRYASQAMEPQVISYLDDQLYKPAVASTCLCSPTY